MRDLHGTLTLRRAYEAERRVEVERPELERELGPFEVAVDDDGRCIISAESGYRFEARLSSKYADARLTIEELRPPSALDLCNCCEVRRAEPTSRAAYCSGCDDAARAGEHCWHEAVTA